VVVKVLSRVHSLILDRLDYLVHAPRKQGAHQRSKPIDVVISGKQPCNYTRTKATCRVQASTCEEDAYKFCNEESETDADGGEEGGFVFFGCEHEDGEDEEGGEEHLEEDTLGGGDALAQRGGYVEGAREDGADDAGGGHACEHLG
jgi:hypothetical protein